MRRPDHLSQGGEHVSFRARASHAVEASPLNPDVGSEHIPQSGVIVAFPTAEPQIRDAKKEQRGIYKEINRLRTLRDRRIITSTEYSQQAHPFHQQLDAFYPQEPTKPALRDVTEKARRAVAPRQPRKLKHALSANERTAEFIRRRRDKLADWERKRQEGEIREDTLERKRQEIMDQIQFLESKQVSF